MRGFLQAALYLFVLQTSLAHGVAESPKSGEGLTGFGGKIAAIGVNNEDNTISGYYRLRNFTRPDGSFHANCTILFSGRPSGDKTFNIHAADIDSQSSTVVSGRLFFDGLHQDARNVVTAQVFRLKLNENLESCSQDIRVSDNELQFSINEPRDWKRVSAIRSSKAYFHSAPDRSSAGKAYLVEGDLIYVYEDKRDWYYVKLRNRKKETSGWIKSSDTVFLD